MPGRHWSHDIGLSRKHVSILDALLLGGTLKHVAKRVWVAPTTADSAIKLIMARYGLNTKADLAMWWALWLKTKPEAAPKHIPPMPATMWPFTERTQDVRRPSSISVQERAVSKSDSREAAV